jgi:malonate transporter
MLALGRAFGITGAALEQMVLIATLPPVFAGMILAIRYHSYVEIASSTLIVSALLFAVAAPIWIVIARRLDA